MWNWILLIVIVGGVVALLAVAAVRQRRYAGDTPIGEQHRKNTEKGPGDGSAGTGGV
jgi:heme/copper-type cytochrome/quinol oxidase subunit 2